MNFDLCDHWVIYDPLRSEKTVTAVDRIKTVLSCSHIDISFQEISKKSVEPVLMVVKGLSIHCNYMTKYMCNILHIYDLNICVIYVRY